MEGESEEEDNRYANPTEVEQEGLLRKEHMLKKRKVIAIVRRTNFNQLTNTSNMDVRIIIHHTSLGARMRPFRVYAH